MAPPPDSNLQDSAVYAHATAAARDPHRSGFGYLAGDPASGAVGAFVWFATLAEMLDFLSTTEIALLRFEDQESVRIAASLGRAIGTTRDVTRLDRHALSEAFEGWSEILWIGTFADLCAKGGTLQTSLRASFRADLGFGEHAGPIADGELEQFVTYLTAAAPPADVGAR